jgi:hypothetical protein
MSGAPRGEDGLTVQRIGPHVVVRWRDGSGWKITPAHALRCATKLDLEVDLGRPTAAVSIGGGAWLGPPAAARRVAAALRHAAMPEGGST